MHRVVVVVVKVKHDTRHATDCFLLHLGSLVCAIFQNMMKANWDHAWYTMLYCSVQCCTSTCCTAPYYTTLHCTALHCTALHCTALNQLYCAVRNCMDLHFDKLHFYVACCTSYCTHWYQLKPLSALQLSAVKCTTVKKSWTWKAQ